MKPKQQRMIFVGVIIAGVSLAAILALTAIGKNIMYFYSPSQIIAGEAPRNAAIRVGGLVVDGSVVRNADSLAVTFTLTDTTETIDVEYNGILPDLFREGQGIVAIGKLHTDKLLVADQVLAKHDENYMPPEVADALHAAQKGQKISLPASHQKPK